MGDQQLPSPLERAAAKWLDEPSSRPLLDLASWGLEMGLAPRPLGNLPTEEAIADRMNALRNENPEAAVAWVEGNEEGATRLPVGMIEKAVSAEEAASLILEAIADRMMEEAPG